MVFIIFRLFCEVFAVRVAKPINNNIVSVHDENGQEIVVMGRGIGYKAKSGDDIPGHLVEKIFRMSSQNEIERLKELLSSVPQAHIDVTAEIIAYAAQHLEKRLNESIYLTLTDHISFSINRLQQGMHFHSTLLSEIRQFYPEEYAIGKYGLQLIEQQTGLILPKEEAASIALHIINAEYDTTVSDSYYITRLVDSIASLLKEEAGIALEEQAFFTERFLTHLKYLTRRVIKKEPLPPPQDATLYTLMKGAYPVAVAQAERIAGYIEESQQYTLSTDEISSLAIHIKKITDTQ
ncbi:PRD domain-containing protein [Ruminococcaceae bacterium OttesenSCG-928-A16]|nr:PRD domain-containing protein [Ruminococcaceae bacterium OttesenSCG-928-A16]